MTEQYLDPLWIEHGYGTRFQGFQNLMRHRIRDVLLVSSLYDLYLFEEDGQLYELIRNEYQGLHLSHAPELTRVSSGKDALALAGEERRFDLIITTLHIEDMTAPTLARMLRESGVRLPIVLLAYDTRELKDLLAHLDPNLFDQVFIWQGDFRLLIAIIKHLEDRMNIDHDTRIVGVQSILLIEDSIRSYSYLLPIIYSEILNHSQRLIAEGINLSHKYLRMRARPKILLCANYEQAWDYFELYADHILGVISDIAFPHHGKLDSSAGLRLAAEIRKRYPDIPILLQTSNPDLALGTPSLDYSVLWKNSPGFLNDLRRFMTEHFSFGDFIFRTPDGREVARAHDLRSLREQLKFVPDESIVYHGERNHFSNWLKARTEFWLAHKLRPRKVSDYQSTEALREDLIRSLREYRRLQQRGLITEFSRESFDPRISFARIGGGSLGGKARGLGFVNILSNSYDVRSRFEGIEIYVPPAVVLGTEVFDRFLDDNDLRRFALEETDDVTIREHFLKASRFPQDVQENLASFLELVRVPLAVRSSSLLEDSQYHPFAGVYETDMIPNNHSDPAVRLRQLIQTIKRVYASCFYHSAKDYIRVTSYHLEEEKMAVIIQKMVGATHGARFYPDFAGVAKSYNFYPISPQKPMDGIVSVALGLGKMVVDGGISVRFCPKYPKHLFQLFSTKEAQRNNQRDFYALDLTAQPPDGPSPGDLYLPRYDLGAAERDGTLSCIGSTYSAENDAVYDGVSRPGVRLVTFAPILRNRIFPLAEITDFLLEMGSWGMGTPVEIEFAVNLFPPPGSPREFGLLQIRPLVLSMEMERLDLASVDRHDLICMSDRVLGHGVSDNIHDIVFVDIDYFDRTRSAEVAREVTTLNEKLLAAKRPYLLIGVGRWGSLDPWLGVPVKWDQICGASAIVEAGFKDLSVDPSQGSHFFQNLTSFRVGYFTVHSSNKHGFVDWEWLRSQPAAERLQISRHIRLDRPITVKINGPQNKGIILKPHP